MGIRPAQLPRPRGQKKAPLLGLVLCHHHLGILNIFIFFFLLFF